MLSPYRKRQNRLAAHDLIDRSARLTDKVEYALHRAGDRVFNSSLRLRNVLRAELTKRGPTIGPWDETDIPF